LKNQISLESSSKAYIENIVEFYYISVHMISTQNSATLTLRGFKKNGIITFLIDHLTIFIIIIFKIF